MTYGLNPTVRQKDKIVKAKELIKAMSKNKELGLQNHVIGMKKKAQKFVLENPC